MSDQSGGPDWWVASDGKWYPPQPDASGSPAPSASPEAVAASATSAPWYRRGWRKFRTWPTWVQVVSAIALVVLIAAAAGSGGEEEVAVSDGATTTERQTTTTERETTTTTEPPTTTTTVATTTTLPPPTVYDGSGAKIIDITKPGDGPVLLYATHSGSSNFIVTTLDAQNARIEGVVNEIGNHRGLYLIDVMDGEETKRLQVEADGAWHFEVRPLMSADAVDWPAAKTGSGPYVFLIRNDGAEIAQFTHDGDSNFIVTAYSGMGRDGLVNEIGPYSGENILPEGPTIVTVEANGNWSVGPPP